MHRHRRTVRTLALAILPALGNHAHAQAERPPPAAPPSGSDAAIPTLEEVRALPPEPEVLDLYRFRNPVQLEPNPFDRAWHPPPTVEEVSLNGGYIFLGINYALYQAGKGLHRLGGGPDPIQAAIARPPPLDAAQLRRAATHCPPQACGTAPKAE